VYVILVTEIEKMPLRTINVLPCSRGKILGSSSRREAQIVPTLTNLISRFAREHERVISLCDMKCAELIWFSFRRDRGSRVRELRRHVDTPLETRRHWPLPLQRLRALLQDERSESTSHQTETTPGKYLSCVSSLTNKIRATVRLFPLRSMTKTINQDI